MYFIEPRRIRFYSSKKIFENNLKETSIKKIKEEVKNQKEKTKENEKKIKEFKMLNLLLKKK